MSENKQQTPAKNPPDAKPVSPEEPAEGSLENVEESLKKQEREKQ